MLTRREFLKAGGALALSTELPKLKRAGIDIDFGAIGDGVTDDSKAVLRALQSGQPLTGNGKTYGVSGNFNLPDRADLEHLTLKQLAPGHASRRTLLKNAGTGPIRLSRVKVDRNGSMTDGSVADAAGIWLANLRDVVLEDIEITGNSKGSGLIVVNCSQVRILRPNIHDMRWAGDVEPGTEQLMGLWMNACTDWVIEQPNVSNIDALIGGKRRAYQTDGISISGCSVWRIVGGTVRNCGEGIDVSGTKGNSRFEIANTQVIDIDSHGFKFANTASQGKVTNTIARNCGFTGHVVSGASRPNLPKCEDITFTGCKSISTGSNGNWGQNTAGFAVMTAKFDTDWPQGITFIDCEAIDEQRPPTMKYGFRSDPPKSGHRAKPNRLVRCKSSGHVGARMYGAFAEE